MAGGLRRRRLSVALLVLGWAALAGWAAWQFVLRPPPPAPTPVAVLTLDRPAPPATPPPALPPAPPPPSPAEAAPPVPAAVPPAEPVRPAGPLPAPPAQPPAQAPPGPPPVHAEAPPPPASAPVQTQAAPAPAAPAPAPVAAAPAPPPAAVPPPADPPAPPPAPPQQAAVPAPPPAQPAPAAPPAVPPTPSAPAPAAPATPPAWQRFQVAFDANERRPRIAVVVSELGLRQAVTERAIALPGAVTLLFNPYAPDLPAWIARARAAGHEVLVGVPMEPANPQAVNLGPVGLLTTLDAAQNRARLAGILDRAEGVVGIANLYGERFAASADAMRPVLAALAERGLMILDTRTTLRSAIPRLAGELGVPRVLADREIDLDTARAAIDARLNEVERIAREAQAAVALGTQNAVTIERIGRWLPTLDAAGFVVAPLTALTNVQRER